MLGIPGSAGLARELFICNEPQKQKTGLGKGHLGKLSWVVLHGLGIENIAIMFVGV